MLKTIENEMKSMYCVMNFTTTWDKFQKISITCVLLYTKKM